jgi:hypothetical protein
MAKNPDARGGATRERGRSGGLKGPLALASGNVAGRASDEAPLHLRGFQDQETWKTFAGVAALRGLSAKDAATFADEMLAEFKERVPEER